MNKEKQELLNNPLVKEIALEFISHRADPIEFMSIGAKETVVDFSKKFELYKQSQQPHKEWEVVRFKNKETGGFIWPPFPGHSKKDYCGEARVWDIHSVKRLSDGEVFTVGDEITDGKIRRFKRDDAPLELGRTGMMWVTVECGSGDLNFTHIKKAKRPLFTTADNVVIYKGDVYWWVSGAYDIVEATAGREMIDNSGRFSTKKAADNYVKCHKPMLSLSEVLETIEDVYKERQGARNVDPVYVIRESLKELAKSKMK